MAGLIPQAFLNGLRAAGGMGMQDTRNPQQRSIDQMMLGASGNPNLVYNQSRQPNPSFEMLAQQQAQAQQPQALPVFRTNPVNQPQGGSMAMPSWNGPQRAMLPAMGQRMMAPQQQQFPAARLPMLQAVQGGPSQQQASMPMLQRRQLPVMNYPETDRINPFAQYMVR